MNIAIIYSTKYGTTAKLCAALAAALDGRASVSIHELRRGVTVDVSSYDTIVLATSMYAGKPRQMMADFCRGSHAALLGKCLCLITCGMDLQHIQQDMEGAYPATLRSHAAYAAFVEGEYRLDRMNIAERLLLRVFFKVREQLERNYAQKAWELSDNILNCRQQRQE